MDAVAQREHQVLAIPPTDKDARATREVLASAGIAATICADMADLCRQLDFGAGVVLLTDASIKPDGSLAALATALERQPKWSDVPIVLLASGGANSPIAIQAIQALQNVLVLDRPVHLPTLVSAVRTSLRSRQRQYEIRDHLDERERAEEALRESEQRFRTMAESIPQLAWMAQPDGHIFWYNRRWYEYTGTTLEQMEGWGWQAVHDPDELPRVLERWEAAITEGKPWEDTFPLRRHDGTMRPHLSRAVPMCDQEGRVMRWFGTNTDITERIETEQALHRAKEAAETANAAKSRFLANMSHELRTPMNAILGLIDVALPKATDPIIKDCLQTAKGSADLLLTLLNDLLDSARIESGKLEMECAPFSLRRTLEEITRVLSVRANEKGLSFYCQMPDEIPDAVIGDRTRLQQVLLNLAGNAIKFTERGEVEVSVHILSQEDEACLEFAVRDTGIGISSSDLERLFQPFAQADASMTRRFGGTGLGLSISKSLVEMMAGRIWVESKAGKGSTFYFTVRLPLAKELPSDFEAPIAIGPQPHRRKWNRFWCGRFL
jgi:PAS domain S-box-containing protein